jgi:parallel beta-helix repeat protein
VNFVQEYKIPAKIIIKPGIYRECIELKGGRASKDDPLLIIEAEEKGTVILSGSDPLSGWTKENRGYSAPWSYKWGLSQLEHEETLQYAELGRRKELVVVNNTLLNQKLSLDALEAGAFFVDEQRGKLHVQPQEPLDIYTADVQVGVRSKLFEVKQRANFILRGITFQHAMGSMHESVLRLVNVSNFLIEDCVISNNAGIGIELVLATNGTLRRVSSTQNGGNGMDMYITQSMLVEESAFSFNCWRSHQGQVWHYFPAGAKLCHARNNIFRRNSFVGNLARGFWIDINGEFNIFTENLVMDNTDFGVFVETCHGPTRIEKNRISGNNYGIMVAESWLTELVGNIIFQNRKGQVGVRAMDDRSQRDIKNRGFFYAQETRGEQLLFRYLPMKLTMRENILFANISEDFLYRHDVRFGTDFVEHMRTYRGDHNILYHTEQEKVFRPEAVYTDCTLEEWQKKTGQDQHSAWKDPKIYYADIQQSGASVAVTVHNPKSAVTRVALYGAKLPDPGREELYFIEWNWMKKLGSKEAPPFTFTLSSEIVAGNWMVFAKIHTEDEPVLHSRRIATNTH